MTRADDWNAIADSFISAFELADDDAQVAHAYAAMVQAISTRYGWDDPRVTVYLEKVYERRNPDGGWGLGFAYDQWSDGSVNPATTTYTVTLADHVGPMLLDCYAQGLVPGADISTCVSLIMTTQTATFPNPYGRAISYSRSSNDNVTPTNNRDVHNVVAHAGAFLSRANEAGFNATGLNRRIVDFTRHEVTAYNAATTWWPYTGTGAPSDTDHAAAEAEAMLRLAWHVGREVAYQILANGHDDEPAARIAWARLAGLPPGPGAVSGDTTLWLTLADQWMDEVAAYVTVANARQKAQVAYWAARAGARAA